MTWKNINIDLCLSYAEGADPKVPMKGGKDHAVNLIFLVSLQYYPEYHNTIQITIICCCSCWNVCKCRCIYQLLVLVYDFTIK